jgi:hypothetical protein
LETSREIVLATYYDANLFSPGLPFSCSAFLRVPQRIVRAFVAIIGRDRGISGSSVESSRLT